MVAAIFEQPDGTEQTAEIADGVSLMEGALRGGVDGIDADCGGELACATCHVHVSPDWLARVPPPSNDERDMLEFAVEVDETSRLSCQILMTEALDGLRVRVPTSQH